MPETIVHDDAEMRIIEATSSTDPDKPGGWRSTRIEWKPGSKGAIEAGESTFIADRLPQVIAKARAIMADPVNATDFTVNERKAILAALVLDLNQRRR